MTVCVRLTIILVYQTQNQVTLHCDMLVKCNGRKEKKVWTLIYQYLSQ